MRICEVEGCNNKHQAKGCCRKHYYEKNIEITREKNKEYRERNKEKIRESNRIYKIKNREKILEKQKQYHEENREREREYKKQYRIENREEISRKNREYKQTKSGIDSIKRYNHNRRVKLSGIKIPKNFIFDKLELNNHECGNIYCSKKIDINTLWLEHLVPVSKGGTNDPENLDVWCPSCNNRKKAKTLEEFYLEESKIFNCYLF